MTPLPKTDADFTKYSGVKCLKSGKWLARIWHPSNKVWVLLGTYSSHEEAANAYTKKKLEYESLSVQEVAAPIHAKFTDSRKHPGVRRTKSGKWTARIKHNKISVWLGTYNTEKEAADACNVSKLEYDSQRISSLRKLTSSLSRTKPRKWKSINQKRYEAGVIHPEQRGKEANFHSEETSLASSFKELVLDSQLGSIHLEEKGKPPNFDVETAQADEQESYKLDCSFGSTMMCQQPSGVDSDLQEVGSSSLEDKILIDGSTRQEHLTQADKVISEDFADMKKVQGSVYQVKAGKCRAEIQKRRVRHRLGAYATAEDAEEALNRKKCELGLTIQRRPRRVYLKKNGRWQTEIRNPITKARLHLGTFDTAEEAEEAYNKKRREFDLMVLACKEHKHSNVDCKMEGKQSKDAAAVVEGKSDSAYESGKPSVSIDQSLVIKDVREEETGGNIINVYDQNMQIPFSESKGEIDLGIINSYGQLVGEYSRMDDELWLC